MTDLEQIFKSGQRLRFEGDPVEAVQMPEIRPIAWVENRDSSGLGSTVKINEDGLTITNGKIFIADEFGETVLSGAGFSANWLDFLVLGVYNGTFGAGTTDLITAATETGGGDTDAEYAASLSDDIPYWVVESVSGAGSFRRVADSEAVGGYALEWRGDMDGSIYQDVPVVPGTYYGAYQSWKYAASASDEFTATVGYSWRGASHELVQAGSESGINYTDEQGTFFDRGIIASALAPVGARYLRLTVQFTRVSGEPVVDLNYVRVDQVQKPSLILRGGLGGSLTIWGSVPTESYSRLYLDPNGHINLGGGSAIWDTYLSRTSSEVLFLGVYGQLRGAVLEFQERTDPSAADANKVRLYARDNGAGKTQLVARFSSGAVQVIATQP